MPPVMAQVPCLNTSADAAASQPDHFYLPPYPEPFPTVRRLRFSLCPLDITNSHSLCQSRFEQVTASLQDSPLVRWTKAFLTPMWRRAAEFGGEFSLHDPLVVWFAETQDTMATEWGKSWSEDVRIESTGQWTRGSCVVDRRTNAKKGIISQEDDFVTGENPVGVEEKPGDRGSWRDISRGNRVSIITSSPVWSLNSTRSDDRFAQMMLERIFSA